MNSKQDSDVAKIIHMILKNHNTLAGRNEVGLAKKLFLESQKDSKVVKSANEVITYLQNRRQTETWENQKNIPLESLEVLMEKGFPASVTAALSGMD